MGGIVSRGLPRSFVLPLVALLVWAGGCGSAAAPRTATSSPPPAGPAPADPPPAFEAAVEGDVPLDDVPDAPVTAPALHRGQRLLAGRGIPHRLIHFTFDDGPRPATTPRLLTLLSRHGVRATFFLVTRALEDPRRMDLARATVRRMAEEGHTIGLHGHDHTGFRRLSDQDLRHQLRHGARLIESITARPPHLVRPPYGGHDRRTDRVVARLGLRQVLWSMTPERPRSDGQGSIVAQFRQQLAAREAEPYPGTVVLLHDTRPWVVEAIPRILRHVQRRNCQLLREGGELWDIVPTIEHLHGLDEPQIEDRQAALRRELAPRCGVVETEPDDGAELAAR